MTPEELAFIDEVGKDAWVSGFSHCLQRIVRGEIDFNAIKGMNVDDYEVYCDAQFNLFIVTEIDI